MLPKIPYTAGTKKRTVTGFGGLDLRAGASGGFRAMTNMTGDRAPLLSSRPPRYTAGHLTRPNGVYAAGRLFTADGTALYADGTAAGTVTDGEKTFCALGERVVIFPDKLIYTRDGTLEPLEVSYAAAGLVFGDGTYAGEAAELNSITTPGAAFPFRVGDAVTISGCAASGNNKTPIIREISDDGKTLRFYENTFVSAATETGTVTLSRTVPDLDYLCANENRLWGCKGDTIWCCKLGDPYNWNVFDGLSTDAWSVETGFAGDFTGCVSYLGYPVFFKEERIFKVYGDKPSNFQVMSSATLGVLAGAHKTLAIAGETLYYLSRAGVAAYAGGIPSVVSGALGELKLTGGVAGSDGLKYYLSAETAAGEAHLLVYDTRTGLWHREDGFRALQMAWYGGLYALGTDGTLALLGTPKTVPAGAAAEGLFESSAEFPEFDGGGFDSKFPTRLWLRAEAAAGVTLTAQLAYDGGGWETAALFFPRGKRTGYFPVPIRRCDRFALRLGADGPWKLYALQEEYVSGQNARK